MHNLLLYYLWAKHSFPSAGTIASHLTHILQCTHWWSLETHTIPSQRCCQQVWFWSSLGQNSDSFTQNKLYKVFKSKAVTLRKKHCHQTPMSIWGFLCLKILLHNHVGKRQCAFFFLPGTGNVTVFKVPEMSSIVTLVHLIIGFSQSTTSSSVIGYKSKTPCESHIGIFLSRESQWEEVLPNCVVLNVDTALGIINPLRQIADVRRG